MADEIIVETTSTEVVEVETNTPQVIEVGVPGPQGPTGATGATGPAGPTIAAENAPATNNILWEAKTGAFTAVSGGRYVASGTFTVTNPASGNDGEMFQVVVASGTVTVNGVAYATSRWPVTVARVSGSWTTLANSLTENLTLNGTNSTAPNQTAASGSSIMTRDLVAQRNWDLSETPRIIEYTNFGSENVGGSGSRSISVNGSVLSFFANTSGGHATRTIGSGTFRHMLALDNSGTAESGYYGTDYNRDILWRIPFSTPASPAGAAGIIRIGVHSITTGAAVRIDRNGWQVRWQISGNTAAVRFARMIAPTITNGRTITGATNASPIVLTFNGAHGLVNGDQIEVGEVGGNTAANGIWLVDNVTSTTAELVGSTGNAAYTSGGAAHYISNEIYTHPANTHRIYYVRCNAGTMSLHVGSPSNTALASGSGPTGVRNTGFFACVESTANADLGFFGFAAGPFTIAIR
jgi:hypothetical protein